MNRKSIHKDSFYEGRFRTRSATLFSMIFLLFTVVACGSLRAGVDFIVPGVSLKSVQFEEGASVSYMIISEAYGVTDTTMAGLTVLSSGEESNVVEIVSSSWPVLTAETVTVRLELGAGLDSATTPEEVGKLILKVLVREGSGEFRQPTGEELEEFGIERLFLRQRDGMTEEKLEARVVQTPAGEFECEATSFHRSVTSRVDLGGVGADRFEEETSTLMTSADVPFWGLVHSRVESSTWTRLDSFRRRREPRPKVTVTESVLIGFRHGVETP